MHSQTEIFPFNISLEVPAKYKGRAIQHCFLGKVLFAKGNIWSFIKTF